MILSVVNFINPFPTWLHFQELFMSPRLAATSIIDWHEKSQADHTSSTDCMLALYQGPPHLRNSPSEDILVGVFAHDGTKWNRCLGTAGFASPYFDCNIL